MAAAITIGTAAVITNEPVTISVTGASASTDYIAEISTANGHTLKHEHRSDGSGAFSFTYVPQTRGQYTVSLRPKSEYLGTTTAAATATGSAV